MWEYTSKNSYPSITLHDCTVESVRLEKQDIVFMFDDGGFWISKEHPQNPFGESLRTGQAELRFTNVDPGFLSISVYHVWRFAGRRVFTTRRKLSFDDFAAKINSGMWAFEVVDEYYGYRRAMFCGYAHANKKPYFIEMQIEVYYEESQYRWNKIYEDRTW